MDIKKKYLDIQLVISGYLAVISKIFKCAEINIRDITVKYLDIATKYMK